MLGRLLEPEEQSAGPLRLYAIGRERVEDIKKRKLYILHGFQRRKTELCDLGAPTNAGALLDNPLGALGVALVKVAEGLAAKSGGAANDVVRLEVGTKTNGHKAS